MKHIKGLNFAPKTTKPLIFQGGLCYNRNVNQIASEKRICFVHFSYFWGENLVKMRMRFKSHYKEGAYEEAFMPFARIVYVPLS